MAPSGTRRRPMHRKQLVQAKKQLFPAKKQQASKGSLSCNHSTTITSSMNQPTIEKKESTEKKAMMDVSSDECSTPKGDRYRIPKISSCPPAPKKRRVISYCSSHRLPISFFASPDIELFFQFALRNIAV